MSGLKTVSYIDHLAKRVIDSLERRRLNQDLMLCYKLQNYLCDSSICNLFITGYTVARGNRFKIAKLSSNLDINLYCYRIVDILDYLPFNVVTVDMCV